MHFDASLLSESVRAYYIMTRMVISSYSSQESTLTNNEVSFPLTCLTAAGCLINKNKVLLVKHKKLGLWLNPGGHIEPGELPHEAAEREFYEETGIFVEAIWTHIDSLPELPKLPVVSENQKPPSEFSTLERRDFFTPNPISTNVHWISEKAFLQRMATDIKKNSKKIDINTYRQAVCEQHLCFLYLVRPLGTIAFKRNEQEIDDIGWFTQEEAFALPLKNNVRQELQLAFKMSNK